MADRCEEHARRGTPPLRESMAAYGEFVSEPDVAEQLAAFYDAGAPARALMAAQVSALGEAA